MEFRVVSLIGRRPRGRSRPANGPKNGSFWLFKGSSAGTLLRTAAPVQFNPPGVAAEAVVAAAVCDNDGIENIDNEIEAVAAASPATNSWPWRMIITSSPPSISAVHPADCPLAVCFCSNQAFSARAAQ